jgi:hypothetical protein
MTNGQNVIVMMPAHRAARTLEETPRDPGVQMP